MSHMPVTDPLVLVDGVSVRLFGAIGDGVRDDTAALQAAIDATAGRLLCWPKGKYLVTSTLHLSSRCNHWFGEMSARNNVGGTEITYTGTGPAIEIGTDNGEPWDGSFYDGLQDQTFEHIWINHTARDTNLDLPGIAADATYNAGSYGILDWRGGGIVLRDVGIEGFEYNFFGVQSDLNRFYNLNSHYSKYGIYLGPRTDQNTISELHSFFCQRCVTVDRATQVRLIAPEIIFSGTAAISPVEIRKGSSSVQLYAPWFENSGDNEELNFQGWVGAGLVDGYGASGVGTTTTAATGINIHDPIFYTTGIGSGGHVRTLVALGAATGVRVYNPNPRAPNTFATLNALIEAPAGTAFTATESQCAIYGAPNTVSVPFLNSGTGAPRCAVDLELVDTFLTIKAADYTVKTTDRVVILSGAAAPRTFTLPSVPRDGQQTKFCNADAGDDLTIARAGGKTINDAASNITLAPGEHVTLFYVAAQGSWYTIG